MMHEVIEKSLYKGDTLSVQFEVSQSPMNRIPLFWARYTRNTEQDSYNWFRIDCNQSFWIIWNSMESHLGNPLPVPQKYWEWAEPEKAKYHNAAVQEEKQT